MKRGGFSEQTSGKEECLEEWSPSSLSVTAHSCTQLALRCDSLMFLSLGVHPTALGEDDYHPGSRHHGMCCKRQVRTPPQHDSSLKHTHTKQIEGMSLYLGFPRLY